MNTMYTLCCSFNPIDRLSENYLKKDVLECQGCKLIEQLEGFVAYDIYTRPILRTHRFDAAFTSQELADAALETLHDRLWTINGLEYKTWCMIQKPKRAPTGAIMDKHVVELPASSEGTDDRVFLKSSLIDRVPADRPVKLTIQILRNGSSQSSEEQDRKVESIMKAQREEVADAFEDEQIALLAQEYRQTYLGQQQTVHSRLLEAGANLVRRVTVKQQGITMDYHGQVPETALHLLKKHIKATQSLGVDAKLTLIVGKALHSPCGRSTLRITLERYLQTTKWNWVFKDNKFEIRFRRELST